MNKAIIMGRLTRDPELRTLQDNVSLCNATVAVDRRGRSQSGERQTDFIPVVFWRQQAEFVSRYFTKGQRIAIVGRIQVRNYETADGQRRTMTEVVAEEVHFADSKPSGSGDGSAYRQNNYDNGGGNSYGSSSSPARSESKPPVREDDQKGGFTPTPDDDIALPFDMD